MRRLYSLILYLCLPAVLLRLLLRARRDRRYLLHLEQRLGLLPPMQPGCIWIHAVSAGETNSVRLLVQSLHGCGHRLLLTASTPTGRAAASGIVRQLANAESGAADAVAGGAAAVAWLPIDCPDMVARALKRVRPALLVLVDTELWPNLVHGCGRHNVPVMLVNGRMSVRAANGYRRLGPLARAMFQGLALVASQTEAQSARFRSLGAQRVETVGSLKFDQPPAGDGAAAALARNGFAGRGPVLIAASTHRGEEAVVLEAWMMLRERLKQQKQQERQQEQQALLVLAPRHVERSSDVHADIRACGLTCRRFGDGSGTLQDADVLLVDVMGRLDGLFAAAAEAGGAAFVGGSLVPVGGHNLIEPARHGLPLVMGRHTFKVEDIADWFVAAGALRQVATAGELAQLLETLFADPAPRRAMGEAAAEVVAGHRGAVERTAALLDALLVPSRLSSG